ncbi:hypothetical protein ABE096_02455 [Robertmurraya massiliosenegalensis]|uniref:hypothetical protein n=1 Tax=Robertmurraya TaxID=2837507 RepID=UPI0039A6E526
MGLASEIGRILLPFVIVCGIAVFVVIRMKHKYTKGTLGKKKSKNAQNLLNNLITLGMMIGCALGVLISIYFPIPLLSTISLGAGIGLLFGYFAYEIYSKQEESY